MKPDYEAHWDETRAKLSQLEAEIHKSAATADQRADMLHTLSKARMFASDMFDAAKRAIEALRR